MPSDGNADTFNFACRCGSEFSISQDEFDKLDKQQFSEMIVQCDGCTQRIRVINGEG